MTKVEEVMEAAKSIININYNQTGSGAQLIKVAPIKLQMVLGAQSS